MSLLKGINEMRDELKEALRLDLGHGEDSMN